MKEFTLSNKQLEIYSSFILIMYLLSYHIEYIHSDLELLEISLLDY